MFSPICPYRYWSDSTQTIWLIRHTHVPIWKYSAFSPRSTLRYQSDEIAFGIGILPIDFRSAFSPLKKRQLDELIMERRFFSRKFELEYRIPPNYLNRSLFSGCNGEKWGTVRMLFFWRGTRDRQRDFSQFCLKNRYWPLFSVISPVLV